VHLVSRKQAHGRVGACGWAQRSLGAKGCNAPRGPPAEILRLHGEPIPSSIGEDLNALWSYCESKGGSIPKPDYTAGLLPEAFSREEIRELKTYSSPRRPFLFTPNVCFPFLTCEAKSGDQTIGRAQSQNMDSGSIAVAAILELYKAAFGPSEPERVEELYGQVLAFSVSHDNVRVSLWGHYAVMEDIEKFYYYEIDVFSLTVHDGSDKNKGHHFVRNVYEKFVPEHEKRIKAATARLLAMRERSGLSFVASGLSPDVPDPQPDSQNISPPADSGFRVPGEPASALRRKEVAKMREQMLQEKMESKDQIEGLLQQIEQQRKESLAKDEKMERQIEQQQTETKAKEERIERQMEQQQMETKAKEERMERQMEQQRQESKAKEKRMERQLEKMMSLLEKSQK
jgi:hypothetical protein